MSMSGSNESVIVNWLLDRFWCLLFWQKANEGMMTNKINTLVICFNLLFFIFTRTLSIKHTYSNIHLECYTMRIWIKPIDAKTIIHNYKYKHSADFEWTCFQVIYFLDIQSALRKYNYTRSTFYFYQSFHWHFRQLVPACIGGHFTVP